jgi:3-oxoacyl-[acyl-carrier-protein] synthase III
VNVALTSIAPWVPPRSVAVAELAETRKLADVEAQTFRSLGIDTVAEDPATPAADMAAAAGRAALSELGLDPAGLGALLVIQPRVPEFFMASEATRVQAALGATKAMTFSVADLGCVSSSAALVTGRALLAADDGLSEVLVVHASKSPTPRRYRHPVTINGEGAIAFVLARDGRPEMIDISLETDGSYWDLFRVAYRDVPYSQWYEHCASPKDYSFKLAIESRNRFTRMNEAILARNGQRMDDVDHFVMQNLSLGAFQFYEEFFGITIAKACKTNLQRYGHLGSMDVILNIHTAMETGEFSPGDLVLVMNNSPVAAWSTMLVRI